ncbi:MAG: replicative DNA helicase [Alphaproteobacteria bacterium]|nr:replicative DNA helicase [Alphaproteobacteria bacterium]
MSAANRQPMNMQAANEPGVREEYRELPHNLEAEQALLGALMIHNDYHHMVGDFLTHEHFYEPVHGRIYAAIEKCLDKGLLANPLTLQHYFEKDEALEDIGGAKYLGQLAKKAGRIIDARDYGWLIHDLALKRQLVALGENIVNTAYTHDQENPGIQQIEHAEQSLFDLAVSGTRERSFESLGTSVEEAIRRTEFAFKKSGNVSGITSGFVDLDRLLGGFQNSDLIIIAGRPSMGKTALATTMAFEACEYLMEKHEKENNPDAKRGSVGIFSLERSSEQLAARLLASATGVNASKLRRGDLTNDEFAQLIDGGKRMKEMPLFIDDTPALTISALRTRARRLKRTHNLQLLVIDYLQLMRGSSGSSDNRVQEVSEITQGLKAIAKELDIPVIALSQLSRAVESRDDKRPQLSDLRESGSIEKDSDIVMFVFREEYYLARKEPREGTEDHTKWQAEMEQVHGVADVIIAKQRHGPIGTVKLAFIQDTTRFADLEKDDYTPHFE